MSAKPRVSTRKLEYAQELEDEWLAAWARKTLKNIQTGKEKTISWMEMKKRIK